MADMATMRLRHADEGDDLPDVEQGRPGRYGNAESTTTITAEEEELNDLIEQYPLSIGRFITLQWNFNRSLRKPYEDPVVIIGELARSTSKGASHRIWRNLMSAIQSIAAWKEDHATWKDARANKKMPRLPTFTQIQALRYIDADNEDMPGYIVSALSRIKLYWVLTGNSPTRFWRDAHLDDCEWRERHMADSDLPWPRNENAPDEAEARKVDRLMHAVFPMQPAGIFVLTGRTDDDDMDDVFIAPPVRANRLNPHPQTTYRPTQQHTRSADVPYAIEALQAMWHDKITTVQTSCADLCSATCTLLTHLHEEVTEQKAATAQLTEELRQTKQRLRHLEAQAVSSSASASGDWPSRQQQQQQYPQQHQPPPRMSVKVLDFLPEREREMGRDMVGSNGNTAKDAADGLWNPLSNLKLYDRDEKDRRATLAENSAARDLKPPAWS
jgi:hypothetical protein